MILTLILTLTLYQVAKHDLSAVRGELKEASETPAAEKEAKERKEESCEAEVLQMQMKLLEAKALEAEGRLAQAIQNEKTAREESEAVETRLRELSDSCAEAIRFAETEAQAVKNQCDEQVEEAMRGRRRAEERLAEAMEAENLSRSKVVEGRQASDRGMAYAAIELEAALSELEGAKEALEESRKGQSDAAEELRLREEKLVMLEGELEAADRSRGEAERSLELEGRLLEREMEGERVRCGVSIVYGLLAGGLRAILMSMLQRWGWSARQAGLVHACRVKLEEERAGRETLLREERKEASRRVREVRSMEEASIREMEGLLSNKGEMLEAEERRSVLWRLASRLGEGQALFRRASQLLALWHVQLLQHKESSMLERHVRGEAVRKAIEAIAMKQWSTRLKGKGFQAWWGATEEARKSNTMQLAMTDLSGIVSRLTGVDFKRPPRGGSPELMQVEPTTRNAVYASPVGKAWGKVLDRAELEPVTPLGGLTPNTKAACSAVLGWSESRAPVKGFLGSRKR